MTTRLGLAATLIGAFLWTTSVSGALPSLPFPKLEGPEDVSPVRAETSVNFDDYNKGGESRVAVLLLTKDCSWLGLAHGLRAIGIPTLFTTDYEEAIKHRMVLLYPADSGYPLPVGARSSFRKFVQGGGTLIGIAAHGIKYQDLFGYSFSEETRRHVWLRFHPGGIFPGVDPRELELRVGRPTVNGKAGSALRVVGYGKVPGSLAEYEDQSAAIVYRKAGSGTAIAVGLDLGYLFLTGYDNRGEATSRAYINDYEPAVDIFLRLLKAIYVASDPRAVVLYSVPFHKALQVVLTHDVNYPKSLQNALEYAKMEKSFGASSTFFVQTKYMKDYADRAFFDETSVPYLKKLLAMGMTIGSNSVVHSLQFSHFPLGSGRERYPSYAPRVLSRKETQGGTILGELRVSKFLLEKLTGSEVSAFRAAFLLNPYEMPQALEATGYAFSSSAGAADSLTHLPFQLTYGRGFDSPVDVFEFPLTMDAEEAPATKRLTLALKLAEELRAYGAMFNLRVSPNQLGAELDFEKRFIEATKPYASFASLKEYGFFWRTRNKVEVDVTEGKNKEHVIALGLPAEIAGLSLEVPRGWKFTHVEGVPGAHVEQTENVLVFSSPKGGVLKLYCSSESP